MKTATDSAAEQAKNTATLEKMKIESETRCRELEETVATLKKEMESVSRKRAKILSTDADASENEVGCFIIQIITCYFKGHGTRTVSIKCVAWLDTLLIRSARKRTLEHNLCVFQFDTTATRWNLRSRQVMQ